MKQEKPKEIIIHPHTFQKFMKYGKDFSNLVALYTFYIYHANHQKTNQPLATNNFVRNGLGWSLDKIKRIKRILKELGLIEVIRKGLKYYVRLPFIYTKKKIEKIIDSYKKEEKQEKEKSKEIEEKKEKEKKKPDPFVEYLVGSFIPKRRAIQIKNIVFSIEDIDKYQNKFNTLYLAKWLVHCERMGIRYNKGNLISWIKKMSSLFYIEQYKMVENSAGMNFKDLKPPKILVYQKYKGRSIKFEDGKIYKNLINVFYEYENNIKYYQFGEYYIKSSLCADKFFEKFEYHPLFDRVKSPIKRF